MPRVPKTVPAERLRLPRDLLVLLAQISVFRRALRVQAAQHTELAMAHLVNAEQPVRHGQRRAAAPMNFAQTQVGGQSASQFHLVALFPQAPKALLMADIQQSPGLLQTQFLVL